MAASPPSQASPPSSSPSSSPPGGGCVLCCGELEVVALGRCEHPVCYRCSVRMRALCGVRYCAVCREELAQSSPGPQQQLLPRARILPVVRLPDLPAVESVRLSEFVALNLGLESGTPGLAVPVVSRHIPSVHSGVPPRVTLVVFGRRLASFSTIVLSQLQHDKKYDIYFTDGKVYALYRKLLQHECPLCPEARPFATIVDLEQHMRKQHELFCCKLCVKHLKASGWGQRLTDGAPVLQIFTHERKWYSRKDLARHRIHGDPDDTSHRGHPLCKFCDERYLDNDELLKHLRRDHYFCHFCDSDGAQEYYSDYEYLREHFREKHFLCEEGRCSTEQFTHAFRTEIDYKAHKTACHSKNRAEARQNRQIDLQFSYAPRHQRRNEGAVSGEDYEEVDRYSRQGRGGRSGLRGGQQNRRGSWRYKREEEDRDVAAAVRASLAAKRQEEKKRGEDKEDSAHARKEEAKDPDVSKRGPKPSVEAPAPKEAVPQAVLTQEDFPAIGSTASGSVPSSSQLTSGQLKEEDFPSLSSSSSSAAPPLSSAMSLTYTATAKKSSFQEEDFPALVSKVRPGSRTVSTLASAWSNGSSKKAVRAVQAGGPGLSQPAKKPALASSGRGSRKSSAAASHEDEDSGGGGTTTKEVRSAPTMVDVSSLLAASSSQTFVKVGKKKRVGAEKPRPASPPVLQEEPPPAPPAEKVPEAKHPPGGLGASGRAAAVVNGHPEKAAAPSPASKEPPGLKKPPAAGEPPLPQEDFPALGSSAPPRMPPPPGFNSVVLLNSPPPPPGLPVPPGKPPPGFASIPPVGASEPAPTPGKEAKPCQGSYLILENFQQRNIRLIQSIKEFLQNDESQFNKFKTYSGQFRQGLISAAQYYRSCQELLGENFRRIFNELLVLLPDTGKQQELLAAHHSLKAGKPRRARKSAWQADPGADLDCCVCPTCRQVLTPQDLAAHKALHPEEEDDEFPSLQAISRIIS
ncbi:hypothetical protein lerEdw1_008771 [Lerista edwardsae]|nr:hypothetical protein lerEdw1_008771 [Lerista edwardsae]